MRQCARRWFDENDVNHLANFGKYLSAMVAAGARLTYARQPDSHLWLAMVLITSVIATVYQLYWDFVKDWGFFNLKCKNTLLRDDLVLKNKIIYYVSIVSSSIPLHLLLDSFSWLHFHVPAKQTWPGFDLAGPEFCVEAGLGGDSYALQRWDL